MLLSFCLVLKTISGETLQDLIPIFLFLKLFSGARSSLVAEMVKSLPAMQETQVRSLGREYPLEKGMATHCGILAWRIPWTHEPGVLQSIGLQRVGHG